MDLKTKTKHFEIVYNNLLNEGEPLEHSDKWGKPCKPYSVSLPEGIPYLPQSNHSIEFYSRGILIVGTKQFTDE